MPLPTGLMGSIYDSSPSNELGGLCTGIGFGTNSVYGAGGSVGIEDTGLAVPIWLIGADDPQALVQAIGYDPGLVEVIEATTDVPAGGTVTTGNGTYTNVTGSVCRTGDRFGGVENTATP